jgi:predicted lipoprotein with Yx(FWY)xxD motif
MPVPFLRRNAVAFAMAALFALIALGVAACGDDSTYGGSSSTATAPAVGAASASAAANTNASASDGGYDYGAVTDSGSGSPTAAAAASGAAVKVGDSTKGKVLTDSAGKTLYTFKNDTTPGKSACNGGCASTWPALTATAAPSGVSGAPGAFALITRDDGSQQVTYKGAPLYRYSGDAAAGDTKGDGIGNIWFVAAP